MIFEQSATGGCQSYLIGCPETCAGASIDPEPRQIDRYIASAARDGLRIRYLIDTHTHADHFSATRELAAKLNVPVVMHELSSAPYASLRVNDGAMLAVGNLRDTLLIGATGRIDLPTGDADALYDSLFNGILKLDPALRVFPAHDYMTGGKTVAQLLGEAAAKIPFISLAELEQRIGKADAALVVLDVREKNAFEEAHVPGAKHLPRGQLELRISETLPDPTARIVTVCEFGKISTLAAATLRDLGFLRAAALDGGMKAWRDGGFPVEPATPAQR